ncbi:hypothetical protein ABZ747_14860 [Kitasatospora cineracea]|uniref:hypothetical protein n=1 Tax=Kitasatospora cineracea TaxID=88074 RepID=UPI0033D76191
MDEDAWDSSALRAKTLAGLLALVGPLVETAALPQPQAPVRRLEVFDPLDRPAGARDGTVLVAVGVDPHAAAAEDLLRAAGDGRAAAVVLREVGDGARKDALREAARRAGTALLLRAAWAGWPELITALRAAVESPAPGGTDVPLGDLGGLARRIALQVGGAVTIEDPDSRVLAHHAESADLDGIRLRTVLTGTVPEERRRAMDRDGFLRELWSSHRVLHRRAGPDAPERMAVAVQAGGERLGSIWVAAITGRPLQESAVEVLRDAARAAAVHLLHHHSRRDARQALLLDAARAVLDGPGAGTLLAGYSGIPADAPCAVLAVGTPGPVDDGRRVRLERQVRLHQPRPGRGSLVLPADRGVLVLLGGLADRPATAAAQAADFGHRLATELSHRSDAPVLVGLGPVRARLDDAARSRHHAELALGGLLFGRPGPEGRCATVEQVADAVALRHLLEALHDLPLPVRTSVSRLIEQTGPPDEPRKGEPDPPAMLYAYLRRSGALGPAADDLGLARTTFAARFQARVLKPSGLDVNDPDARLLAHLQLRALRHRAEEH